MLDDLEVDPDVFLVADDGLEGLRLTGPAGKDAETDGGGEATRVPRFGTTSPLADFTHSMDTGVYCG
jgi:hypothetical protein